MFCIEILRKFEVILTRLRIGHSIISHRYLMAKRYPPICSSCGVQVTIKNILTECQIYLNNRTISNLLDSVAEIFIIIHNQLLTSSNSSSPPNYKSKYKSDVYKMYMSSHISPDSSMNHSHRSICCNTCNGRLS